MKTKKNTLGRIQTSLLLVMACGVLPPRLHGQAASAPVRVDTVVSVKEVTPEGKLVRVPVNKSVLVEFAQPVRELRLAKPEFAEVTAIAPKQIMVTGKTFGTTQMIVFLGDNEQRVLDLAVDIELDRMVASIQSAVPRAKVRAYALLDAVVLTGQVPDADSAQRVMEIANVFSGKVINQMQVAGVQQILLRCTVAEMNRSATRQLGFNGWLGGDNFHDFFGASNLDQINPSNIGAPAGASFGGTTRIPMVAGTDGIPITDRTTLSLGFPRVQMQIFVQALRENGLLKVLAEPTLVAMNGQEANFLAGGEIPIPITTANDINVQFKQFGVRLNFTPSIVSQDQIRLKVAPEVSEPDFTNSVTFAGISIPGFATRRIETVVELGSGQTLAIGGLLSEHVRAISRKVPALGDVPIIGALFSSVNYQSSESELVVMVTPELVAPISADQVTCIPGAKYTEPNDFELYLMGELDGYSGREKPVLKPRVNMTRASRTSNNTADATPKLRGPVGPAGSDEGM